MEWHLVKHRDNLHLSVLVSVKIKVPFIHEGVSKSFRTDHFERELQMVHLSATRCSCIAIL